MYGCEILFNAAEAEEVKATVRAAMGGTCPCDVGRKCPLLPDPVFPADALFARLYVPPDIATRVS